MCVFIGIVVFGVMIYAIIFHRKSLGHQAAHFHENVKVEILWTIIPFIILIIVAIPSTRTLLKMYDDSDADLTIKITGHTWYWEYEYLDKKVSFLSMLATSQDQIHGRDQKPEFYLREVDNPLVLPINKKIRILTTSNDVIHSWWMPEFAVKRDAIPGFINETWTRINEIGTYRGQCAELCGLNHGFMPIVVEAKTPEDFDAWLLKQQQENKSN
jgi:cytochrome c oxidase subunit 2